MKYMSKFQLLGGWGWGEIYEENIICFTHIFHIIFNSYISPHPQPHIWVWGWG